MQSSVGAYFSPQTMAPVTPAVPGSQPLVRTGTSGIDFKAPMTWALLGIAAFLFYTMRKR